MRRRLPLTLALIAITAVPLSGCGSAGSGIPRSGRLEVVAAENFWGSIASQLGGARVHVTSVIANPGVDPHSYEPSADDARAVANAQMTISTGIGYDPWAARLLAASPAPGRVTLSVASGLGLGEGENPHVWYSPPLVRRVIDQITADYIRLDPRDAAYFEGLHTAYLDRGLRAYRSLIAAIRARYAGVPIGASESIVSPLAQALGLTLITPEGYLRAITEGTDPTARDKVSTDQQIRSRQIKVWVYNSQNSTPDVQRLTAEARDAGIAVITVTETLSPATTTFQDWQVSQLQRLRQALARATGR